MSISHKTPTPRPLIHDLGILGGVIISNVVFDRIRPHFHPFMIGLYRNGYPRWLRAQDQIVYISLTTVEFARLVSQYIRDKKSELLRNVTLRFYPFIFDRIRRLYIWMSTRSELKNTRLDAKSRATRIDRHLERASFRYIPEIDECELDDCNEDGLIHAYEKSESTSDTETESEDVWSQADPDEDGTEVCDTEATSTGPSQWGTIDVTSFDPRKNARSSTPVKLNFPKEVLEDTSQLQQSEAKVAALEAQLNEMKVMIAMILENQNKTMTSEANRTTTGPAVNDTKTFKPVSGPPPPPPPPPPPMPQIQLPSANTQLKLKVGRNSGSSIIPDKPDNTSQSKNEVKCMTDVLKGLSNVKLRPTARSPGGTPMKRQKTLSPHDASSMIAQALKKRFARIHSPSDSEPDDDRRRSNCNKENRESGDDSFDNSPLFRKSTKSIGNQKRRSLFSQVDENGLQNVAIPEVSESHLEGGTPPKFGQHLLKPAKISASGILKQSNTNSPLGEQQQGVN